MKNDDILKELHEKYPIEELIKFTELDLQEKLQNNPFQIVHYRDLYHKELSHLDHLSDLLDKLIGLRYEYYRFKDDNEWSKVEIEKYCIPKDKKILRMKKIIRGQEVRVRFFEMAYKAFEKQGWSMKSFIDTIKGGY
jgi:hypothetical protein